MGPQLKEGVGPGDFLKFVLIHCMCLLQYKLLTLPSSGHSVGPRSVTERDAFSCQGSRSHAPRLNTTLRGEKAHGHTHTDSVLTSLLPSSDKCINRTNRIYRRPTHSVWIVIYQEERHNQTYRQTTVYICVFMYICVLPLFVLVKVHWIYLLALRGQCVWDPHTLELWEMRSKVKARNTQQRVCVYWRTDETDFSGRALCTDRQACDGRCSRGI